MNSLIIYKEDMRFPSLFGSGEMYQNERLTWFQKECRIFAGSTRTNNVVPRKSIISGLSSDPASRYTAKQTLFAKYGSWDFYKYSFAYSLICIIINLIHLISFRFNPCKRCEKL